MLKPYGRFVDLAVRSVYAARTESQGHQVERAARELQRRVAIVVVLDNPLVGNALYVITGDWRTLSQLTKRELLDEHREQVRRIVHRGDWFERLRADLR